jgi:hypothetical protein
MIHQRSSQWFTRGPVNDSEEFQSMIYQRSGNDLPEASQWFTRGPVDDLQRSSQWFTRVSSMMCYTVVPVSLEDEHVINGLRIRRLLDISTREVTSGSMRRRDGSMAYLTALQQSRVQIRLSPDKGKVCQFLGGLPPGIAHYCCLSSRGRKIKKLIKS